MPAPADTLEVLQVEHDVDEVLFDSAPTRGTTARLPRPTYRGPS